MSIRIQATNLTKSYISHLKKQEIIFEQLEFSAKPGELTVIMGESGTGKTTLLNLLSTISEPDSGHLSIMGHDVYKMSPRQRAKLRAKYIGFIFQTYALIPELTILENCTLPLMMNRVKKKVAQQQAIEMIERLVEDVDVNKYPMELSGGQQQRIAIIRALIHQPEIIIADEPTGNLDQHNSQLVREELRRLCLIEQLSVIVVTHDRSYLEDADVCYQFIRDDSGQARSKLVRGHD